MYIFNGCGMIILLLLFLINVLVLKIVSLWNKNVGLIGLINSIYIYFF